MGLAGAIFKGIDDFMGCRPIRVKLSGTCFPRGHPDFEDRIVLGFQAFEGGHA